ncbi:MAG: FAD-dependent oxidoreductase [Ardenticatenales bacterium]|nr:FAD-dependent oxidoreductase [Ardenticatenales bacterium]
MMQSTLIIGAGLAGLLAARTLQAAGVAVTVLDKARGVGGRLATRRLTDANGQTIGRFDHGAQYFTARDLRFVALVEEWLAAGVIKVWADGFNTPAGPKPDNLTRYCGTEGMTSLAKHLAQGLTIQTSTQVNAIWQAANGYRATTADGQSFSASSLILTPPAEQSLALLASGDLQLPPDVTTALSAIQFAPCFAVLAQLAGPSKIPAPGGLWPNDGTLFWLGDNAQKGISATPTVTIHATPAFTEAHFELDRDEVGQKLIAAAGPWLGSPVISYQVHRWRYSIPTQLHPEPYLWLQQSPPLLAAGDAFAGPRVEGAALSGLAVAEALLRS